ncbi:MULTISPECIES: phosphomannomutase [unclassified Mesorhizobium]|uniref:phosphomannomutase n=1 Tax=unclassified Mesorhizobium TaxID=325217 RepID=UPI0011299D1E|nr:MULTISPECIES: phosphomannomutase [unclassified Mesorhizobium]MBZ9702496.1 phosphomannomutase [Mesorhizobium sp. CO1-1-3]MBZ9948788.1 phosphomannomutase [Mesorhizobium sp. BR1-1-11]TPJ09594.1 phosphomannomutase [Mesorhizobium sp. B2-8-1]
MSDLKFGTSGLRGLVNDLTDAACERYTSAFIAHLRSMGATGQDGPILVGQDLRASSARIATACLGAIAEQGFTPLNCGHLPTSALALEAARIRRPAIMVTGSHIPDDRNGLKFYRAEGEIDKADEAGILDQLDDGSADRRADSPSPPRSGEASFSPEALNRYRQRYANLASHVDLSGLRVAVYQHSSVARDLLVEVLSSLGASCIPFGRAEAFIPVDTEAVRPEDAALVRETCASMRVDAVVSTDGDADRPMIADASGAFVRGDVIGILTARWLGADAVVTPVTSTSAIEASGLFASVKRTRVGSPYVIEGMMRASKEGSRLVVGFEANGGVLLGSNIDCDRFVLSALPTRDAFLPIIAVLALARQNKQSVAALAADLPPRFTVSDRLKNIPSQKSAPLLARLAESQSYAADFLADFGDLAGTDTMDGVRMTLENGDTVHFRASGNAPELRCYVETGDAERSKMILQSGLERAAAAVAQS